MDNPDHKRRRLLDYNSDDFCSTEESAKALGVSLRTVQLWVEGGALQAWKTPGGHRRIIRTSLQKLLDEREAAKLDAGHTKTASVYSILLVSGDKQMQKTYLSLGSSQWRVDTLNDPFKALLRIGDIKPHLLLVDVDDSSTDAIKMIEAVLSDRRFKKIKIFAASEDKKKSAQKLGLPFNVSLIAKNASIEAVRDAIQKQLDEK